MIFEPVVILKPESVYIHKDARVDSFVKIEGGRGVFIDRYSHVASFAHIGIGGGMVILEEGASVASGGKIVSGSAVPGLRGMSAVAPDGWVRHDRGQTVILRRYSSVLTNAVVLPGGVLNEGSVLAAGAVLVRGTIPSYEVWAGVPARKIGEVKR